MEETWDAFLNLHPFVRQVVEDKIRGVIIGSALGDAIGLYTGKKEFLNKPMSKDAYPDGKFSLTGNVTRFCNDSHRNKFVEGSWTDDTDHSLLITLSYLHSNGRELSSLDFARRLKVWIEQGLRCLDRLPLGLGRVIGSTVLRTNYLTDPKAAAYEHWETSNFTSAPNGSLMRTHPLGIICLSKTLDETFEVATDFGLVTHSDPRCVVSCCIATAVIRAILRGDFHEGGGDEQIDNLVDAAVAFIDQRVASNPAKSHAPQDGLDLGSSTGDPSTKKTPPLFDKQELYRHTKATSYDDLELDDLRKQGYVYKCLGAGILCLRYGMRQLRHGTTKSAKESTSHQSSEVPVGVPSTNTISGHETLLSQQDVFETIISELVMQGGDADTNATVAGAFLGALLGFTSLPAHWYRGVKDVTWLLNKTEGLIQTMGIDDSERSSDNLTTHHQYVGSADLDNAPDGGKGLLSREQLEAREKAFMEMYLTKTMQGKNVTQLQKQSSAGQGLIKKWKGVFG